MRATPSLVLWLAALVVGLAAVIYLWLAISSRRLPALQVWHTASLDAKFHARDAAAVSKLAGYLDRERRVFAELDQLVASHRQAAFPLGRYRPGGRNDPATFPVNWNRSFMNSIVSGSQMPPDKIFCAAGR